VKAFGEKAVIGVWELKWLEDDPFMVSCWQFTTSPVVKLMMATVVQ